MDGARVRRVGFWDAENWSALPSALYGHRKPARVAEEADVAVLLLLPAAAEVEDAEAAEGEVVADGVGGVEAREAVGEGAGGFPVGRGAVVQAEKRGDAMDVGVDGHQQLRGIDERPEAEVGRRAADHPAKKEVHALARAAVVGRREQKAERRRLGGWTGGVSPPPAAAGRRRASRRGRRRSDGPYEASERRTDVGVIRVVARLEQRAEGAVLPDCARETREQRDEVGRLVKAM